MKYNYHRVAFTILGHDISLQEFIKHLFDRNKI